MLSTDPHQPIIEAALAATVHVARDGGIARVQLPDTETGELITVEIDQAEARKKLAWLLDRMITSLWQQISEGKKLTAFERQALADWTAATINDAEIVEREQHAEFSRRRVELYLIKGDMP